MVKRTKLKRPDIPENMKRVIRQRCGFGCVICGVPLYEYHHMLKWSVTKRHVVSEITLLCKLHHTEATTDLLPEEMVREANLSPFNFKAGISTGHALHYSGASVKFVVGGNSFEFDGMADGCEFVPIAIDGNPIAKFTRRAGRLFFDFHAYKDGKLAMKVVENEIVFRSDLWDLEWIGKTVTVRSDAGKPWLTVEFLPPGIVRISRAIIEFNGFEVLVGSDYVYGSNTGVLYTQCGSGNCKYGIAFGVQPSEGGVGFGSIDTSDRSLLNKVESRSQLRKRLRGIRAKSDNIGA